MAVGVDLGLDEFDRVGRADAELGHEPVGTDHFGSAAAVLSRGICMFGVGNNGL